MNRLCSAAVTKNSGFELHALSHISHNFTSGVPKKIQCVQTEWEWSVV